MIKANEFRLGNCFQYTESNKLKPNKRGKYAKIIPDDIVFINENTGEIDEYIKYAHITEELLLKLGFKKREYDVSDRWYIGENPITHDWLFDITWIHGHPNPFYKNGFHEIKYVHQLQNLFFILSCGEELVFSSTEP